MIPQGQPFAARLFQQLEEEQSFSTIRGEGATAIRSACDRLVLRWNREILPQCSTDDDRQMFQAMIYALHQLCGALCNDKFIAQIPDQNGPQVGPR